MRHLSPLLALVLTLPSPAMAQAWPDLTDDAGVQGGGEQDAALIVGVTDYVYLPKIDGAAQNAEAWQQWLLRSRKVPSSKVMLLADKAATRPKIEKALQQLTAAVGPKGTLWFVFIGHGAPSRSGDDGMLLGADTDADGDSIDDRGVPQQRVLSLIGQGKQAHSVVVFDACFSGKTGDGSAPLVAGLQATLPNRKATMSTAPKATVLAASDSFAGPLPNAGRPAFSYLLLGALRGWGDGNGDKAVDVDEAYVFSRDYIQALFKGSDRLPSKRGPSVVLAKNVREKQPDMAALVSGKCPSGWTWGGRECKQQATVECPAGTTWNGTACVSLCPAGTSWNGRACAATTIECPAGTSWNGSTCAATSVACPPDTTWNGTACEGRRLASLPVSPQPAVVSKKGCDPVLDFDCKPLRRSTPAGQTTLEKSDILGVVKAGLPAVKACGEKNGATGTIKMSWNISKAGKPTDVAVADTKYGGTPVGACVTKVVQGLRFPPYSGAAPPTVSIPLPLN